MDTKKSSYLEKMNASDENEAVATAVVQPEIIRERRDGNKLRDTGFKK